jgi:hypothetical protein
VHGTHRRTFLVVFPRQVLLGAYCPAGHVHAWHVAVSLVPVPLHRLLMYSPGGQFCLQFAHTRSEFVSPVQEISLYCPVGATLPPFSALRQLSLQFMHSPSYREDALHILCMYWLDVHPKPPLDEQGTHMLVSDAPLPVHWFAKMCMGLHAVWLHGAHRVESTLVVPSQKPT